MAHPRYDGLLEKVRQLSSKADEQTDADYLAITGFALQRVIDQVAAYTHICEDELPGELDTTIVSLVLGAITEMGLLGSSGDAASLSEGDTSITFMTPLQAYQALQGASTLTTNYLATLNSFRVVKW